jgi:ketosteroid isomerase-like protein
MTLENEVGEDPIQSGNVTAIDAFFQRMREKDIGAWAQLWHAEARIIVEYPPAGFPSEINGKDEIISGFRDLFAHFSSYDATIRAIYETLDPDIIVVEWDVRAVLAKAGEVYRGNNITVFKFESGLIRRYHDYFNPLKFELVARAISAGD